MATTTPIRITHKNIFAQGISGTHCSRDGIYHIYSSSGELLGYVDACSGGRERAFAQGRNVKFLCAMDLKTSTKTYRYNQEFLNEPAQ